MATPAVILNHNNVRFNINADIVNDVLIFTDETTFTSEVDDIGIVKVTHVDTGVILYQNDDWANYADPTLWATPDIDITATAVELGDIPLPSGGYNGTYKVEYYYYNVASASIYYVTRTFAIDYTAPVVSIEITALCSTSQLTSEDTTDYGIVVDGETLSPTTKTRTHRVTKPAGCGADTPAVSTEAVVTVGGGSTAATRLWTKIWQTNIVTALQYTISAWSSTTCKLYISDTVKGDDNINVQCDATLCNLAQCYYNLLDRWTASLNGNFAFREDYRDKIIQAEGLFTKLFLQERCGASTEQTILDLQTLLKGENCNCVTASDTVSVEVVPWAAIAGGSGVAASTFMFRVESSAPSSLDGNNGDIWLHKATGVSDLYQKTNGAWVLVGDISGTDGATGNVDIKTKTLVSTSDTIYQTGANLTQVPVSYSFAALSNDIFIRDDDTAFSDDFLLFTWEVKLAANGNGKEIAIDYGGVNVMTWFTDHEVVAGVSDIVTVYLKVTFVTNIYQRLTAWLTLSGNPGQVYGPVYTREQNLDITSAKTVQLLGTNSVASLGDIQGLSTIVQYFRRETDIIQGGGSGASDGRGLVSQQFEATEGQTEFVVTDFTANSYYIPIIDGNIQSQSVVTRSGQTFTYSPGLSAGQILLIVN